MANIQEGLMAAAPGGFGGAASGLGMALSANPIGAAVTGAGAVFSFLGARKARKERERSKQAALAALAPSGEEASIRSQLLAEARRGAAGGLPPGLELLSRRQEAISGADVARRDEIADVEGRRRLGAVGLLGGGAGQATLGRAAAPGGRRPEITQQAIDNQLRRLIAEQGLAGQRQAFEQSGALFPSTLGAAQTAGRQAEANLARTIGLTPHEIATAEATARRTGDPWFAASFTRANVEAEEEGRRTAFNPGGTSTLSEDLRQQGEEFNVGLGLRGEAARTLQNIGFEQRDPGFLGGSDFGVSLDPSTIALVNAARERKERGEIRAEEFNESVDPFRRRAI